MKHMGSKLGIMPFFGAAVLCLFLIACSNEEPSATASRQKSDVAPVNAPEKQAVSAASPALFSGDTPLRGPNAYRLDERLSDAIYSESAGRSEIEGKRLVLWPPPSAESPWQAEGEGAKATLEDQVLHFKTTGPASVTLANDLQLDAPSVDAVHLRIAVEGADRIRLAWRFAPVDWDFCTKEGNCWVWTPVEGDGIERSYVIRVGDMDRWLQFRVVDGIQLLTEGAATVRIHGVEISSRKGLFAQHDIGAREYGIGNETRQCLYMHTPARTAYRLKLPERPVFTTGLAVVEPDNPVLFQVRVRQGNDETLLLEETVDAPGRWHGERICLLAFAGQEVELEIGATTEAPGQVALWSNPFVYEADQDADAPRMPNILLYLVDALRADRLDAYGYEHATAPTIAQLAESGILFEYNFSHTTCTKPTVMTLFSGADALVHDFRCFQGFGIPQALTLFPAQMRAAGYSTGGVSENPFAPPISIYQRAFSRLVEFDDTTAAVSEQTYEAAAAFLEDHGDHPFFLYIHTMECHGRRIPSPEQYGHMPEPPFDAVWQQPQAFSESERYDGSIVFADSNFRRILEKLEALGLRENTLIIFTSDHGTALGERDEWGHGKAPHNDQIHVPLILNWPAGGGRPGVVRSYTKTADIPATLLDFLGLEIPGHHEGLSLLALLQNGDATPFLERYIMAYNGWNIYENSIIQRDWKFLVDESGNELLFALPGDLAERHNLAGKHRKIGQTMRELVTQHYLHAIETHGNVRASDTPQDETTIDPSRLEMIESLGYL